MGPVARQFAKQYKKAGPENGYRKTIVNQLFQIPIDLSKHSEFMLIYLLRRNCYE